MKRLLVLFVVLLASVMLITGCGGSSSTSDTAADDAKQVEEDAEGAVDDTEKDVDEVAAKIKDGDVSDLTSDEEIMGTWEATNAEIKEDQTADVTLSLAQGGEYQEEIFYEDKEGNVTDTENPNETYKGKYFTDGTNLYLAPESGTVDGKDQTADELKSADNYPETFTYTYEGTTMTLTGKDTKYVWTFVKM